MASVYQYIISLQDKMSGVLKKAGINAGAVFDDIEKKQKKAHNSMNSFNDLLKKVGFTWGAMEIGRGILNDTMKMQGYKNAITYMSGSAQEGAKNIDFLRKTADDLGLSFEASLEGFKTLEGGLKGKMAQGEIRKIFEGVSVGASAMGLSSEQATGAFLALGQMASKGTVQAEELRGQLGERIPGAFGLAARAMGVTEQKLNKMLQAGEVIASDFLPKFAAQMRNEFAGALPKSTQSLSAAFNRLKNNVFETFSSIGEEASPAIIKIMNFFSVAIQWLSKIFLNLYNIVSSVIGVVFDFFNWLQKGSFLATLLNGAIITLTVTLGLFKLAQLANLAITKLSLFWQGIQLLSINVLGDGFLTASVGTKIFAAAQAILNTTFLACPIFWIITGIVALIAAIAYVIYKTEGWRAIWEGTIHNFKLMWKSLKDDMLTHLEDIELAWYRLKGLWDSEGAKKNIAQIYQERAARTKELAAGALLSKKFESQISWKKGSVIEDIKNKIGIGGGEEKAIPQNPEFMSPQMLALMQLQEQQGGGIIPPTPPIPPSPLDTTAKGIAEGGSRPTSITINLQNLVENINLQAASVKEGASEIERIVRESLLRVLNSANGVAYGN